MRDKPTAPQLSNSETNEIITPRRKNPIGRPRKPAEEKVVEVQVSFDRSLLQRLDALCPQRQRSKSIRNAVIAWCDAQVK